MRDQRLPSALIVALFAVAPLVAGCAGGSDLLSKDAEWFARPGRVFTKSISIESPPLTPDKLVTAEDLVSADRACPGMAPASAPADANASTAAAPAPSGGTVALGHTECDVVRGIGAPSSVNLSNNARGDRLAVITWTTGPRAGIYTFTAGRLSSIEGNPEPPPTVKPVKPKAKKKSAA